MWLFAINANILNNLVKQSLLDPVFFTVSTVEFIQLFSSTAPILSPIFTSVSKPLAVFSNKSRSI